MLSEAVYETQTITDADAAQAHRPPPGGLIGSRHTGDGEDYASLRHRFDAEAVAFSGQIGQTARSDVGRGAELSIG
jgi:hypothetical protein